METEKQAKKSLKEHLTDICIFLGVIAWIWTFLRPWTTGDQDLRLRLQIFEFIISTWFISLNLSRILTNKKNKDYILTTGWIIVLMIWLGV